MGEEVITVVYHDHQQVDRRVNLNFPRCEMAYGRIRNGERVIVAYVPWPINFIIKETSEDALDPRTTWFEVTSSSGRRGVFRPYATEILDSQPRPVHFIFTETPPPGHPELHTSR